MVSQGIRGRPDYDFARTLVGLDAESDAAKDDMLWLDPNGFCEVPKIQVYVRTGLAYSLIKAYQSLLFVVVRILNVTNWLRQN